MPKLQQMKAGKNFFLILPKQIVLAKGWQKGDQINVEIDQKGNLVLKHGQ